MRSGAWIGCAVLGLFVGGCPSDDEAYVAEVKLRVAAGPAALCCGENGKSGSDPVCVAEAPKRCAFAKNGRVTSTTVGPIPGGGGRTVDVVIVSDEGTGTCRFQLYTASGQIMIAGRVCNPNPR